MMPCRGGLRTKSKSGRPFKYYRLRQPNLKPWWLTRQQSEQICNVKKRLD